MGHKFIGEFSQLAFLLSKNGFIGSWSEEGHRVVFQEAIDGGILTWVRRTGSIWAQGSSRSRLSVFLDTTAAQEWSSKRIHSIFIVHGRDVADLQELVRFLDVLGTAPKILALSGGGGLTLIEALENSIEGPNSVDFGIVMLSGDDYGYLRTESEAHRRLRARQNVVFEMGLLMAKLGRPRVAMLIKERIELPSDVNGIIYLPYGEDLIREAGPLLLRRLEEVGIRFSEDVIREAMAIKPQQESRRHPAFDDP